MTRSYDVVLFGATGFTGALCADYLARHCPPGTRWAIAGRSPARLGAVVDRIGALRPAASPAVIIADVGDPASLTAMAEATRVLASTVGPFAEHGAPLVAACAAAGTDYLDITGEPGFVDEMFLHHQDRALDTGARMVHCCGFDSIPYDLGAYFSLRHLPPGVPLSMTGYVRASAEVSAGTFHSAIDAFGSARDAARTAARRRQLQPRPTDRQVGTLRATPHRIPGSQRWALPLPTIDPVIVLRSAAADVAYGPEFRYAQFADVGGLPIAAAAAAGAGGLALAAQIPPLRSALRGRRRSGQGPDEARRARSWFRVRFRTVAESGPDAQPVWTEVSGGDPGYDETAKMLGESMLALAFDDLPELAGQLTPVQAMGAALLGRLETAGLRFVRLPDTV